MTLMELMVAIVVTGAVALIGGEAFSSIIEHRRQIVEATIETERAAALRDMLRTWIGSGTIQLTTTGPQGQITTRSFTGTGISTTTISRPSFNAGLTLQTTPAITAAVSTGDELTFTTNALTPVMTPQTRVRLFVDGDAATPEVGLTIEYQPSTASPLRRMQLDSTIAMMTTEFLDQTTNQWVPFSEASTIRPVAVRLYFPALNDVYVPKLLQSPLLFVIGQTSAQQLTGGR